MRLLSALSLLFFISVPAFSSGFEEETRRTTGWGVSATEAIQKSLSEAVGQINGVTLKSGIFASVNEVSVSSQTDSVYLMADVFQQKVQTATQGVINRYDIISLNQLEDQRWEAVLDVTIRKLKLAERAKRKRIAILPMRSKASQKVFTERFQQQLTDYFVQSRKFTILDREFTAETYKELRLSASDLSSPEEASRLGERLVADYILTGEINDLYQENDQRKLRLSNKSITTTTLNVNYHYRLIETATGQVVSSNTLSDKLSDKAEDDTLLKLVNQLSSQLAQVVSNAVVLQIYPIIAVDMEGRNLVFGQGGDSIEVGQVYELFSASEALYDPYTKEYLGRKEMPLGSVSIQRVTPKLTYAELVEGDTQTVSAAFTNGRLIIREPVPEQEPKLPPSSKGDTQQSHDDKW